MKNHIIREANVEDITANSQWGNYDRENKPKEDWKPVVILMIELE